jgi:hypothetical protein
MKTTLRDVETALTGFDTTPKPAFLLAMQNQKWTVAGALSELVDNSFGPGRGNATRVHITHDTKHRTITVLDNGVGMESIGRLFQLGNTIGRAPGDIGLYGAGGTMALLWLASRVEVYTLRDGRVSHDEVRWADHFKAATFPVIDARWRESTLSNTPAELFALNHGTLIRLHLLPARTFHAPNIRKALAQNYAPAMRQQRELVWTTTGKGGLDTEPIVDPHQVLETASERVEFDLIIEIGAMHLPVHGMIGIVEKLSHTQSVVSIGFGPRVITTTRDCYTSADGTEDYPGVGITGWLDLGEGWQPYLATTKDAMNDQPVWDALMGHVFTKIRPLLQARQDEKLTLELNDLALMLESALDGRAHVEVSTLEHEEGRGGITVCGGTDRSGGHKQGEPGDGKQKDQPAMTTITIDKLDDHEMRGLLCKADVRSGDTVTVYVNKEHPTIQEALQAQPINRRLLNVMVTQEIAGELIENQALLQRAFPRRVLSDLEEREERERRGFVMRMLMDRVNRVRNAA